MAKFDLFVQQAYPEIQYVIGCSCQKSQRSEFSSEDRVIKLTVMKMCLWSVCDLRRKSCPCFIFLPQELEDLLSAEAEQHHQELIALQQLHTQKLKAIQAQHCQELAEVTERLDQLQGQQMVISGESHGFSCCGE